MAQGRAAHPLAFVAVNVVPMDGPRVLPGHDVVVAGGRIAAVAPTGAVDLPNACLRIDGRGRFLLPGLADMHVHFPPNPVVAALFLAHGVTTVRNMWGRPETVARRAAIAASEQRGPRLFTCGPIVDGAPPVRAGSLVIASPAEAEGVVAEHKAVGYDFLKIYDNLSPEVYDALLAAAARQGVRVVGHVPVRVPLRRALAAGQASLEHLHGYFEAAQADGSPLAGRPLSREVRATAAASVDPRKFRALAEATAAAGVWNCPTLVVTRKIVPPDEQEVMLADPAVAALAPARLAEWRARLAEQTRGRDAAWFAAVRHADVLRSELVRALRDAGARLLLGTDTANPLVVPGASLHEELRLLVEAGLTPFEALRAGTADAADFLGVADVAGTIAAGKRADLALLEGNPLEEIRHAARPVGVVADGVWLPREALSGAPGGTIPGPRPPDDGQRKPAVSDA